MVGGVLNWHPFDLTKVIMRTWLLPTKGVMIGDEKLYCSGRFTNMSGINASSIARWDGTKWERRIFRAKGIP
jgi:hypothetical protein